MARPYSHRHFFRQTPKDLLRRFFQDRHGVLLDFPFAEMKAKDTEPIFAAFIQLPSDLQAKIEAESQTVDAMACQGGVTALADEADFHEDRAFPLAISRIDGFHGQALWAFLEHPEYWTGASLFLHSDRVAESHWKKRKDLPQRRPRTGEPDIERFARAIGDYFHRREGRGRHCMVDVYRRHDKEYFFAYPEDFAQSDMEWIKSLLMPRARHPAFEIIFVHCERDGSLDIYAPRNAKYIGDLQGMFAQCILGLDELDEFAGDGRVYLLDDLADRNFAFRYPVDSAIESAKVRSLRLSLIQGDKRRITVEADPTHDPKALYDLMERLDLPPYHVTQAEIQVILAPNRRKRSFKISYPNWCALRHDGDDLVIRQMLAASGIEPTAPSVQATDRRP